LSVAGGVVPVVLSSQGSPVQKSTLNITESKNKKKTTLLDIREELFTQLPPVYAQLSYSSFFLFFNPIAHQVTLHLLVPVPEGFFFLLFSSLFSFLGARVHSIVGFFT